MVPAYSNIGDRDSDLSGLVFLSPDMALDPIEDRIWQGDMPRDASIASEIVSEFTGDYPDLIGGSAFSSNYDSLEVYVVDVHSPVILQMAADVESSEAKDYPIIIVPSDFSLQQFDEATYRVSENLRDVPAVTSVTHNLVTQSVEVAVSDQLSEPTVLEEGVQNKARRSASRSPAGTTPSIPITVELSEVTGPVDTQASRRDDTSPFNMGAAIGDSASWNNGGIGYCTLGPPITINGVFYGTTAGHCGSGTYYNSVSKRLVGSTWQTNQWNNSVSNYGDWQLLKGSNYSWKVFIGSATGTSTSTMVGGSFGTKPIGQQLCVSGRTTGQTCRYYVTGHGSVANWKGNESLGQATILRHNSAQNGGRDCSGTQGGDSGGPWYANESSGPTAYGLHSGARTSGSCEYYMTRLSGIRTYYTYAQFG